MHVVMSPTAPSIASKEQAISTNCQGSLSDLECPTVYLSGSTVTNTGKLYGTLSPAVQNEENSDYSVFPTSADVLNTPPTAELPIFHSTCQRFTPTHLKDSIV